jgi:transcriptional regulator with XRE-family HTH domain
MATRMNKTEKLAFYTARKRKGDTQRLAEASGYTTRFVNYVLRGERNVNDTLANKMYRISYRRQTNNSYANA